LFPMKPVLQDAGEAVEKRYGFKADIVQQTMSEVRHASRGASGDKTPISYTATRTTAYSLLMSDGSNDNAGAECFDAWLEARQKSAGAHLWPDVEPCLLEFASRGWLVGAITNGRGNPALIPGLEHIAFCVSGEEPQIYPLRKPNRAIFDLTLERALGHGWRRDQPWWHVGDDLANDCGGAAAAGSRTVLVERNMPEEIVSVRTANPLHVPNSMEKEMAAIARPDITVNVLTNLYRNIVAFAE